MQQPSWIALLSGLAACVDAAYEPEPPVVARVVASWDPRACSAGESRVSVELEDTSGARIARSVPCALGGVTVDVVHYGIYFGTPGSERLVVDAPLVYWQVSVPP